MYCHHFESIFSSSALSVLLVNILIFFSDTTDPIETKLRNVHWMVLYFYDHHIMLYPVLPFILSPISLSFFL
jgi:hypothetical protein